MKVKLKVEINLDDIANDIEVALHDNLEPAEITDFSPSSWTPDDEVEILSTDTTLTAFDGDATVEVEIEVGSIGSYSEKQIIEALIDRVAHANVMLDLLGCVEHEPS